MTGAELLAHLRQLEVRIWLEGDQLRLSAPKGVLSPELRGELAQRKAELMALLRGGATQESDAGTIRRDARDGAASHAVPLSSAQERMWFLEQLESSTANQIVMVLRLDGTLNLNAMRQALDGLVQRHETLRTTFRTMDDRPVQMVAAAGVAALELRTAASQAEVDAALASEAQRPFDLGRGPLLRVLLISLGPERHVLAVTIHHIVCDGWSLGVFGNELSALYEAALAHAETPLPALPIQYADYARWQREWLSGGSLEKQLAYWRAQLRGRLPVAQLPADRQRPPVESHRGGRLTASLPADATRDLQTIARRDNATLFMVLLAAFTALLVRYTGQEDVVVGTPVAGRSRPELEGLIGLFLNTLVLRTDASGDPTFEELLRRVRDTAINAYANQDVPFERLVEELRPERDPSRNPVFQVMFVLQNVVPPRSLPGLAMRPMVVDRGAAQLDLTLSIVSLEGELHAQWEYSTDLFDRATIERMARHYGQLLRAVAADPTRRVSQLPLLAAEDERLLLGAWNATALEHDRSRCVHHLLEAAARSTPGAPAVVAGGTTLSYRELDERANRLARLLVARGVVPGALVAICLDRTVDMPVAMAAVLKAGAAYVPLDPTHPTERLRYILEDAGVACAITLARFAPLLDQAGVPQLRLDEVEAELGAQPASPVPVTTTPGDLAYVIYTSGSTGRPKGVEVEHRNVVSFLDAMRREPGFTDRDVLLAVTTLSFDIAGLELWLPLSTGGRVVIASRTDVLDGERLMALLQEHRITVVQATPATWRLLLEAGWAGQADLKVLCGGEALPRELAATLEGRVGELWNMYGPTETTIWSTVSRVEDVAGAVPIGRPIANTRVYVLEPSGLLAPIGVPGELCIGGEGVARGYRNRPELTAEKFATISLPDERMERVYRTGDVARFRGDGQLEFLGRRDHQVKLRGFRVELGEIETLLAAQSGVKECVVTVREDHPGEQRLVGYVVTDAGLPFDAQSARVALRTKLPEYMVPNAFVELKALPLTPNGKIDRRALPAPDVPARTVAAPSDALMNPAQRRVADIWQEVLHIDRVGLHDNFFDVGGHSLILVKLHAALKREFQGDLTIIDLFQRTTVATQADRLTSTTPSDGAIRRAQARAARQVLG